MYWLKQKVAHIAVCLILLFTCLLVQAAPAIAISESEILKIAVKVWYNESGGSVAGLTQWNQGEDFASVGIGHFIWYPAQYGHKAYGTFPQLIQYMVANGVDVPVWLRHQAHCPWHNRWQFDHDFKSTRMIALRHFLLATVHWQAQFMLQRLNDAYARIMAATPADERNYYKQQFYNIAATSQGVYALVDYVNFKGDGAGSSYNGWGLKQVLSNMRYAPANWTPLQAFSWAANRVLTHRVATAPAYKDEERWLPGWRNRLRTYLDT